MGTGPVVVDTNVLLNLGTPVIDSRPRSPSGGDPLKAVLTGYDVHIPSSVLGEISAATGSDDLLAAAADLVLKSSNHLTTHDVNAKLDSPLEYGLDLGESHGIWLANELPAAMFVTDEFSTKNLNLISLALNDVNTLYTTPHVLCVLSTEGNLDDRYVSAALSYYVETKNWDHGYIDQLRNKYLSD